MAIDYTKRPGAGSGGSDSSDRSDSSGAPATEPVSLTKANPRVSLNKRGATSGRLHVNLNWTSGAPAKKGLFAKVSSGGGGIDLDLGALYELTDGTKGVVQALGNMFGSLDSPPYAYLDGDDRSGSNVGGENLYVNLSESARIKRLLIFAFIYEGVPAFDQADGVVTITPASGAPITVRLDEQAGRSRMCAVALLTNTGGELALQREVRFIDGSQRALDEAYDWGMNWKAGRK
jgi:tellurite resistance protein TerA